MPSVRSLAAATALLSLCGAAAASAAQIEGVHFQPTIRVGEDVLDLNGYALLRYKVLFKGYVAALYLPPTAKPEQVLTKMPKRLEIEYFWDISAEDFAVATVDGIAANVSSGQLRTLQPAIGEFNALYKDVKPGDRYALSYDPDSGTELSLNGNALGVVAGDEFAAAIFAIWLGENPLDAGLKAALLGM